MKDGERPKSMVVTFRNNSVARNILKNKRTVGNETRKSSD